MENNQLTILGKPQTEPRTLWDIKELVEQGIIDLSPEYQRNVVWTTTKQAYLIDSLRNHYYVPPLVFALRTDENGRWKLNVVDGKQRITSILKFFNNLVSSRPPKESLAPQVGIHYSKSPTKRRHVLSEDERKRFDNLEIICIQYIGLTKLQERELFQRMQMGMNLTNPEKLHAVDSTMNDLVVTIQEKFAVLKSMFADNRMRLTMVIAQILCMVSENNYQKIPSAESTNRFLRESELEDNEERKAIRIFSRFAALIDSFPHIFARHISPVEFIFLALMIHRRRGIQNIQLQVMFRNCYRHVRERHPGQVRTNDTVLKTLNDYVESGAADVNAEIQGQTESIANLSPSKFQARALSNNTLPSVKTEPVLYPPGVLYQEYEPIVDPIQEWDEPVRIDSGPSNTQYTIRQYPITSQPSPMNGHDDTIWNQEENVVVISDDDGDDNDKEPAPLTSVLRGPATGHQRWMLHEPNGSSSRTSALRDPQFVLGPLTNFPADANLRIGIPPRLVPSKRPIAAEFPISPPLTFHEPSILADSTFESHQRI